MADLTGHTAMTDVYAVQGLALFKSYPETFLV